MVHHGGFWAACCHFAQLLLLPGGLWMAAVTSWGLGMAAVISWLWAPRKILALNTRTATDVLRQP